MDKFFSIFGKAVLILVILVVLVGGGVYIGMRVNKSSVPTKEVTQTQGAPQETSVQNLPTGTQVQSSPTPTVVAMQTINAGGFGSFPKYTIRVPQGWQPVKTVTNLQDLLTLTNGQYQIQINQTDMGNGVCSYPGVTPEPMSQQYTLFIPLGYNGDLNYYRRSKSQIPYPNGEDQYAICQKNTTNSYSFVTTFGSILYMAPTTPNQQILSQLDQMVQSIQKQ